MICGNVEILSNSKIEKNVYRLVLKCSEENVKPGQFFMLRLANSDAFLGRPLSIYDATDESVSLLYAVIGKGTKYMSELVEGDIVHLVGPLGNGFDINDIKGKVALVSGGIGIAPFLYLAKHLNTDLCDLYAGFRDAVYSVDDIQPFVDSIQISTDTGLRGHKGFITDLLDPAKYDMVITCGPEIMMVKVVEMCKKVGVSSLVSSENRMACGMGACRVCSCKTTEGMKRVCMEGPVFKGEELIFNA